MKTLEQQLEDTGLTVSGHCGHLSTFGPDMLQASPLLQDMTMQEADVLASSMLVVRAEPGQVLIREGDTGEWMLLLLSGTVDVTKAASPRAAVEQLDGEDAPAFSRIAVIQRGAAFGEMSMLDSEPRFATCTAIEAVEAGVLGRRAIGLLIRDHPAVGAKLLVKITQLMAQRLRNTSNHLNRLLQKQPTQS
jgi:CRP/FNR family transcriptional regulator, cyclic AMP receptor protein